MESLKDYRVLSKGGNFREVRAFMTSLEWRRGGGHLQSNVCAGGSIWNLTKRSMEGLG